MIKIYSAKNLSDANFPDSQKPYSIKSGFLGRKGGASVGIYTGLNVGLGSDDDRDIILQNRKMAGAAIIENAPIHSVHQIHSHIAVIANEKTISDNRPQADALVTNRPDILLSILTADCVPILLADYDAGVVGAAHAGWKGAISGVCDNVVALMESLGAKRDNISAAIGPCISQKSYEVDSAFRERFMDDNVMNEHFFKNGKAGRYQFDIEAYAASRLANVGVKNIHCLGQDTYSQEDDFFSYRRSCHRNENGYGRQISIIGMQSKS